MRVFLYLQVVPLLLFLQLGRTHTPPELERLFERICNEYAEWVVIADKQLPPEWDMPDLVRAVIGEEALATPSYMSDAYYDVMLHGQNSWLCKLVFDFIDLTRY